MKALIEKIAAFFAIHKRGEARWVDRNGNTWNSYLYTRVEAYRESKTLTDCTQCDDCFNCISCTMCGDCICCSRCAYSHNLSFSIGCAYCKNSTHLKVCAHVVDATLLEDVDGLHDAAGPDQQKSDVTEE